MRPRKFSLRDELGWWTFRIWKSPRWVLSISVAVLLYSCSVLICVATMGDIGVRCVFGRVLKAEIDPELYQWVPDRPKVGDTLLRIGDKRILLYTDYVEALRQIRGKVGRPVDVVWTTEEGDLKTARATVRRRPGMTYLWSLLWFFQELVIFTIGARVFWKRPSDASARIFFWLCIVTVGAYMGGYHWSEIVIWAILIHLFAAFAVFVPILSLHFYLVFPRPNPIFARHRRRAIQVLYGIPWVYLAAVWATMIWSRTHRSLGGPRVEKALWLLKYLALGYVTFAAALFVLCIVCLAASFRAARTQAERNQVRWILQASLLAIPFIAYLLREAYFVDPATLGLDRAAWPMFVVSLLYTMAYAMSITRYRLMQVEEIYNRSKVYFLVSVAAWLVYWGLVLGAFVIGTNLTAVQSSQQAIVTALTAAVVLFLSGAIRGRFQKAIDRRFYREKYQFDQAMRKMSQAVESLVDRGVLGRRLLEAAAEVLRLEWGAIYLGEPAVGPFRMAACLGPEPDEPVLTGDNPLVVRLRREASIRVPAAVGLATSDPSTDAMIALGGEVAHALEAQGGLVGLMVLGPKRSGLAYEDEEIAFLDALASVATLALHSSGIQQTLEGLQLQLRDKVEKIAEQQRRILILQDQLSGRPDREGGASASSTRTGTVPESAGPLDESPIFGPIKGSGRAVRQMLTLAKKVAMSPSAVLIRGESGTGKELLAEAIHASSPRADRPFVRVHCAALSQGLLESELFGHVKGAFTGADRDRVGRFEQADGGTLFLDEIGDINLEVQTKLLRVLQQMNFERVGSSQTIAVDVRIIAATHQDLEALIRSGRFREDLYYRLNVIGLRTPSLRERKEDIFELAVHFLNLHTRRIGKAVTHLDDSAIEALVGHDWPGNIRELENVIEAAVVLADGPSLSADDLPIHLRQPTRRRPRTPASIAVAIGANPRVGRSAGPTLPDWNASPAVETIDNPDEEGNAFERARLLDALDGARGNKSEAARLLGMPRSTFFSKLKKHGLS